MKFGVFYEHQLPRPWEGGQEKRILDEALEQVVREARKQTELAPFIEAALARKQRMKPLDDAEIPIIEPIVKLPPST